MLNCVCNVIVLVELDHVPCVLASIFHSTTEGKELGNGDLIKLQNKAAKLSPGYRKMAIKEVRSRVEASTTTLTSKAPAFIPGFSHILNDVAAFKANMAMNATTGVRK